MNKITAFLMSMLLLVIGCSEIKPVYSSSHDDKFVDIHGGSITLRLYKDHQDIWKIDSKKTDASLLIVGSHDKNENYQEWTVRKRYPDGGGTITLNRFRKTEDDYTIVGIFTIHILVTSSRSIR